MLVFILKGLIRQSFGAFMKFALSYGDYFSVDHTAYYININEALCIAVK